LHRDGRRVVDGSGVGVDDMAMAEGGDCRRDGTASEWSNPLDRCCQSSSRSSSSAEDVPLG
jgi:hypothetical protein